jgi:hypothetical protein
MSQTPTWTSRCKQLNNKALFISSMKIVYPIASNVSSRISSYLRPLLASLILHHVLNAFEIRLWPWRRIVPGRVRWMNNTFSLRNLTYSFIFLTVSVWPASYMRSSYGVFITHVPGSSRTVSIRFQSIYELSHDATNDRTHRLHNLCFQPSSP